MRYSMKPLDKESVKEYLKHQLAFAGAHHDIFTPQAVEAISSRSRGFPRIINNMAINCLLYGCAKKLETINEDVVFAVATEAGI